LTTRRVAKVQRHVDDAVSRGAEACLRVDELRSFGEGYSKRFYEPTLLAGVTDDMLIFTEETFARSRAVTSFQTDDEASGGPTTHRSVLPPMYSAVTSGGFSAS